MEECENREASIRADLIARESELGDSPKEAVIDEGLERWFAAGLHKLDALDEYRKQLAEGRFAELAVPRVVLMPKRLK